MTGDPREARALPDRLLERELDALTAHQIVAAGARPAAVRGWAEIPANGNSPRRAGMAVICRLYPNNDDTRLAFARSGQHCAEATVFEDPGDQLAWNLNGGFQNALYVLAALMAAEAQ